MSHGLKKSIPIKSLYATRDDDKNGQSDENHILRKRSAVSLPAAAWRRNIRAVSLLP
jgi:hypothetical protein